MKLQRVFSRPVIFLLIGLAISVTSSWLGAAQLSAEQPNDKSTQTEPQLPEGKGKEIVAQKCVACHTLEKVTKEPHTKAEWEDLLQIMVAQGLELMPEEHDTLLQYLVANFGKAEEKETPPKTPDTGGPGKKEITYSKDVAPILLQHCVACHHPNDIAPMSLLTYKETRPWAMSIREKVVQRVMPPWHADPKVGEFSNDPRLSEAEIETIRNWVSSGAKEGDPKGLPPAPEFREGWHIKPDVIFSIPEQVVSSADQDEQHYFYVPTNFKEDVWVQAAEVLPGARRVVHHAEVHAVSADKALNHRQDFSKLDPNDAKYFFKTGTVLHIKPEMPVVDDGCEAPAGGEVSEQALRWNTGNPQYVQLAIYLPGHGPEIRPPGYAVKVPAGSYLEFNVHYSNRLNEDMKDQTSIGLVFAKEPVKHAVEEYEMYNELFLIPPNDGSHRVTRCQTVPADMIAIAYTAHMHFRGKSMTAEAVYPDGQRETLMNVPHYDFRWQETYFLKEPKMLPKGTQLRVTAYFDNSPNNPLNPDPSKTIRFGESSYEEMVGFWLQYSVLGPPGEKSVSTQVRLHQSQGSN